MDKERIEEGLRLFFADREDGEAIIAELSERPIPVILEWLERPNQSISFLQINEANSLEELKKYVQREEEKLAFYEELRKADQKLKKKKIWGGE